MKPSKPPNRAETAITADIQVHSVASGQLVHQERFVFRTPFALQDDAANLSAAKLYFRVQFLRQIKYVRHPLHHLHGQHLRYSAVLIKIEDFNDDHAGEIPPDARAAAAVASSGGAGHR